MTAGLRTLIPPRVSTSFHAIPALRLRPRPTTEERHDVSPLIRDPRQDSLRTPPARPGPVRCRPHAFFNDGRPVYDADSATRAWESTVPFLHEQLG